MNGAFLQADYMAQVLEPHVLGILEDFKQICNIEHLFMEDGNAAHGLKSTRNAPAMWKALHKVPLLAWAFNSPDMNPIEQIWRIMKQNLRKRRAEITNLTQYRQAIQEEWDAILMSKINELIGEMERRVDTMYTRFGDATGF